MKNLKFRVKSEAHSKAIQERLFELDCMWCAHPNISGSFKDKPFLYLFNKRISYGDGIDFFNDHENKEATLEDLYDEDFIKEEKPITIAGYKAEIRREYVKFGCQKIRWETIEDICELSSKASIFVGSKPLRTIDLKELLNRRKD